MNRENLKSKCISQLIVNKRFLSYLNSKNLIYRCIGAMADHYIWINVLIVNFVQLIFIFHNEL